MAVRLPRRAADKVGLRQGMSVLVISRGDSVSIKPLTVRKTTLAELVAGITKENKHETISWGKSVGKEIW